MAGRWPQPDHHQHHLPGLRRRLPADQAARSRQRDAVGLHHAVRLHAGLPGRLPGRLLRPADAAGPVLLGEGRGHLDDPLRLPGRGHGLHPAPRRGAVRPVAALVPDRPGGERGLRAVAAGVGGGRRHQPRQAGGGTADRRPGQGQRHQRLRPGRRQPEHLPDQRPDGRSQSPGRDAVRAAAGAAAALPVRPARPAATGAAAGVPADGAGADAVPQRRAGRHRRPAGAGADDPAAPAAAAHAAAGAGRADRSAAAAVLELELRPHRDQLADERERQRREDALRVLLAGRPGARPAPAVRHGLQHVRGLLPVPDGQVGLRPAQLLGGHAGRDRGCGVGACTSASSPG